MLNSITAVYTTAVFVVLIAAAVVYVLSAYPLYRMAKNANYGLPWLAWIPVANCYLIFILGDGEFTLFGRTIRISDRGNAFWLYLASGVITFFLEAIPYIGNFLGFCGGLFSLIVFWKAIKDLMDAYDPDGGSHVAFSIFAVLIDIVRIVALWMYKDNIPVYARYGGSYENPYQNGDTFEYGSGGSGGVYGENYGSSYTSGNTSNSYGNPYGTRSGNSYQDGTDRGSYGNTYNSGTGSSYQSGTPGNGYGASYNGESAGNSFGSSYWNQGNGGSAYGESQGASENAADTDSEGSYTPAVNDAPASEEGYVTGKNEDTAFEKRDVSDSDGIGNDSQGGRD